MLARCQSGIRIFMVVDRGPWQHLVEGAVRLLHSAATLLVLHTENANPIQVRDAHLVEHVLRDRDNVVSIREIMDHKSDACFPADTWYLGHELSNQFFPYFRRGYLHFIVGTRLFLDDVD